MAHLYDPAHPAVLRLVAETIAECRRQGKGVSVCGEMAGDVAFTRLLLGMGLRSFSMHPSQILAVKQEVLRADTSKLDAWAQQVLEAEDPAAAAGARGRAAIKRNTPKLPRKDFAAAGSHHRVFLIDLRSYCKEDSHETLVQTFPLRLCRRGAARRQPGRLCSHRHGWGGGSEQDRAEFRARMVERVGSKLELDAAQKQKLTVLAEKLQAQRAGAARRRRPARGVPRPVRRRQARPGAARGSWSRTRPPPIQSGSPEVIAAAADFFDNLNPAQQQKVREFMDRGRRWHRHG